MTKASAGHPKKTIVILSFEFYNWCEESALVASTWPWGQILHCVQDDHGLCWRSPNSQSSF